MTRFHALRRLHRALQPQHLPSLSRITPIHPITGSEGCSIITNSPTSLHLSMIHCSAAFSSSRSIVSCACTVRSVLGRNELDSILPHPEVKGLIIRFRGARSMSSTVPAGARKVALKVTMQSPGFIYEPYQPREPIPFWKRWFTPSGWRRSKEDIMLEMKSAYAITRLRKVTGYSKKLFYQQAVRLYKEINILMANGDMSSLRKMVTEKMYSTLKNEIKRREAMWACVSWELVEPVVTLRTLRARMIAIDKDNLDKAYVQLTLEFIAKQKFEAYDSKGTVVSGDKTKEVLVRDIWVFERSLFHPGAEWRLCGRISV